MSEEIDQLRQECESDEMWALRRQFLETYWTDERFKRKRLLCLSQILINLEFLNCKYNEKLMKYVTALAEGMADSRRERRREIIEKVFLKPSDDDISSIKRGGDDSEEFPFKKKNRPEMVDLGGGFWRQGSSAEIPITETKLNFIQRLKEEINIAPDEMKPLELLYFACNRCKLEWSIEFTGWLCKLKIENVVILSRHYWGDYRRSREEVCQKAKCIIQRTWLDVRQSESGDEFLLFTSNDSRKTWQGPDDEVLEPLINVIKLVKGYLITKDTGKWCTAPKLSLETACKSEGLPFLPYRQNLGEGREEIQIKIGGEVIYYQQGKVPSKNKENEPINEACLKTADLIIKLPNDFNLERNHGKLTIIV